MNRRFFLALLIVFSVCLAGCTDYECVIHLKNDGSGDIVSTIEFDKANFNKAARIVIAQFSKKKVDSLTEEEQKNALEMFEDVTAELMTAVKENQQNYSGLTEITEHVDNSAEKKTAIYKSNFGDINKLVIAEDKRAFSYANDKLEIDCALFYDDLKEGMIEEFCEVIDDKIKVDKTKEYSYDFMSGLHSKIVITFDRKITKTNASYQTKDGKGLIIFDVDYYKILEDEDFLKKYEELSKNDPKKLVDLILSSKYVKIQKPVKVEVEF